ncbi:transcriptional regulator [Leptospira kanakyensis]|uniref:Transcriptional regulator n=1 Tax=Leptospira kanakyensis TaxID=2484968 RepID=A0A6N4QBD1_9LEPT|nr:transcriptional regulator [Leptospira kanakyensis]TGK60597.1 transcriptional regulator [Leptospira kanakyensis]TGK67997.1 transcriptional regulator [Leptospira kanakyensis]
MHSEFLGVVVLSKVCVSETETKLELYTKESKKVCVLKEGMLFRDDLGTSYPFLKSEGVGLCPKRTQMKNTPFTLHFPSIPSETKSFDLIEDKNAKHAHKPWVFEKVDLTQCVWK